MTPEHIATLSKRGQSLASNPSRIDMEVFLEAGQNLYDPDKNPNGAFPLNVAENNIMTPFIRKAFDDILKNNSLPAWTNQYTHPLGNPEVREIMANFLKKTFSSPAISAESLVFSAGASASLEAISFALAKKGDIVVIPAPAYPMYTNDLRIKSGMERHDIHTHYDIEGLESLALLDDDQLEYTLHKLDARDKEFKILLVTTPDNPSGSIYSKEKLEELAIWCMDNEIHFIVNEIYALSQIDYALPQLSSENRSDFPYPSFPEIMAKYESPFLHWIYALSKDFCASGYRFGIIHTLNESLIAALSNINIPHMVSNITQWMVGEFFSNHSLVKEYILQNQKQISKSYSIVTSTLKELAIPYTPARGSLFVWADFSKYLSDKNDEEEMKLWMDIYQSSGVLLTPGIGFGHQKRGIFRIVHTAVPLDHLIVAMKKLADTLKTY